MFSFRALLLLVLFAITIKHAQADGYVKADSLPSSLYTSTITTCTAAQTWTSLKSCVCNYYTNNSPYQGCYLVSEDRSWPRFIISFTSPTPPTFTINATLSGSLIYTCPAGGGGLSGTACTCNAGFVPSVDGSTQAPAGSTLSTYCIASTNAAAVVTHTYSIDLGAKICDAQNVCTGPLFGAYSSPALACASQNATYSNQSTACTLVQGTSCICSTTYSDGSPPNMTVSRIVDSNPCPVGDLICSGSKEDANTQAATVSAAASAAARATLAAGGTAAAAVTAATTAATAANNAVTAGSVAGQAAATAGAISNTTITNNTTIDITTLAKTGEASTAAASIIAANSANTTAINSKLDELKTAPLQADTVLGTPALPETITNDTPIFSAAVIPFDSGIGGCPSPHVVNINVPYFSASYSFAYEPICDLAVMLKPLFLALAAIAAAFIFVAGLTI